MGLAVHFTDIKPEIRKHLNQAQKSIKVAVAWLTDEDLIFDLIRIKQTKNVQFIVEVVISCAYENFRRAHNLEKLVDAGVKLRVVDLKTGLFHRKFCVIDSKILINGSYNWTYYASTKNEENIVVMNLASDDDLIKAFEGKFAHYFSEQVSNPFQPTIKGIDIFKLIDSYDEQEAKLRDEFQRRIDRNLIEIKLINETIRHRRDKIDIELINRLIKTYGDSVNLVKKFIYDETNGDPKSGFKKLAFWGKMNLSFEQAVLDYPTLFSEQEINVCRKLLR